MIRKAFAWAWLVGVAFPAIALAQATCYSWWKIDAGLTAECTNPDDCAAQMAAYCNANPCPYGPGGGNPPCTYTMNAEPASGGFPNYQVRLNRSCAGGLGDVSNYLAAQLSSTANSRLCPTSCPAAGTTSTHSGSSGSAPATICDAGCAHTSCGVGVRTASGWAQQYCSKGATCGSNPATTEAPEGNNSACETEGGTRACSAPPPGGGAENCGTFNGDYVCVGSIPPGTCVSYASGGIACVSDSGGNITSPPAPNNGTEGETPEPTGVVETADGARGEYYGPGTMGGGGTGTGGAVTGAPGGVPVGSPGPTGDGGGGGGGGGTVEVEVDLGTCTGAECDAGVPELEEVGTLGDAFGGFWGDLQAVPIVAAAGDIAPAFGAGACPNWSDSIAVFGETWEMDFSASICTTWADVSDVLSIVMLVFWGFVAFRILFSA